jgi:hypothetical protein
MSQSPEMPATGWFEQPPEPVPYPTEPWNGRQQDDSTMPQPVLPPEPAPMQAQQGYAAYEAEGAGLPTEFDHLFRGSPQDSRRSIDRQRPGVGAVPDSYQDPQYQAQVAQQAAQMQSAPMQAPEAPYSAAQFQSAGLSTASYQAPGEAPPYGAEQYGQPEYPQAPGYGQPPQFGNQGYGGPGYGGEFAGQGGGGDGSGGWNEGGGGLPGSRKRWLIGGGVAAVAVIGIVYALSSGGGSGKPNAHTTNGASASAHASTPQQQAQAIYTLIAESEQLRTAANDAVVDVNACRNLTDAQSALTSTAQQRQQQADQVAKLDVTLITHGTDLVQELQQAWTASAKYDSAYASIAGDVQTGCKTSQVKKDPNYQTANTEGAAASQAKVQAAELWNTNVAGPLGQGQITESKL